MVIPADSEEINWFWDEFKSESLPDLSTLSINQYLVSFVVRCHALKSKTLGSDAHNRSLPSLKPIISSKSVPTVVRRVLLVSIN